ncbi:hypothetical protein [Halopenitus persicus]|uniref:hypothetical protein n=1 Tax=Halopenitus persicus TaxID=1048396 RepID=UPI0018EEC865|nr:hypothetical protein [Halopenitus persicus]
MSSAISNAWEEVAADPDPNDDLDYDLRPLTVVKIDGETGGQYMILPGTEDHLLDEEFIIADPGSICRLDECR